MRGGCLLAAADRRRADASADGRADRRLDVAAPKVHGLVVGVARRDGGVRAAHPAQDDRALGQTVDRPRDLRRRRTRQGGETARRHAAHVLGGIDILLAGVRFFFFFFL